MSSSARISASLLLAVLVAGGLLVPSLHRLHHAEDAARIRAAHLADGHHDGDARDAALDAPCPNPATEELPCAVCVGLAFHARPAGIVAPSLDGLDRVSSATGLSAHSAESAGAAIRGPPPVA